MMFGLLNIGPWELILILIAMLIVFGPGKLPEVAQSLGKAMREFRKASSSAQQVWDEMIKEEPVKPAQSDKSDEGTQSNEATSSDQTGEKGEGDEQHQEVEGQETAEEKGEAEEESGQAEAAKGSEQSEEQVESQ
ncbi:MAG: twin-arginine translocase TatA/TatE family subunit [Syntrophaceticus sp.]|nr:twin-arginine translocase TatA/TatE family subunit [Syntrophaceticus sp.]MDD3315243.1 twin-arginine translocase TatA/TatE family subunit [Syntrophaceticus sp.]MDD4359804.1 twin-arginine translocase TatA/TatE family subunit [Syntrophaceticus sp.]MDD4782442.1 twin-arginine translocase TatA/TatE family subunit [Syntrophaceticus sp.]